MMVAGSRRRWKMKRCIKVISERVGRGRLEERCINEIS